MTDYYVQLLPESLGLYLLQAGGMYFLLVLALATVSNLIMSLFQWLALR